MEADSPPTTLMLHGVPGSRTVPELRAMFAGLGFGADCIDFMKLPQHPQPRGQKRLNKGYCFLSFTSIDRAEGFATAIQHHPLGRDAEANLGVFCTLADRQRKRRPGRRQ